MKGHDSDDPPSSNKGTIFQPVEEAVVGAKRVQGEIVEGVTDNAPESGENNTENIVAMTSN